MKKLSIVGKGTVGCLAASHFLRHTDWEIDWVYDPNTPATSVGEGTTVNFSTQLANNLGWTHDDLFRINGTVKQGIYKKNWGDGGTYLHAFGINAAGIHMNAVEFQNVVFDDLKQNSRINLIEDYVSDPDNLDSDYVLMCAGSPKSLNGIYDERENISVNSAYVTQCYWDYPQFTYTLTIARPYGWVFGIPLQNRCSIGYIFNKDITTLEEVKEDVKVIFDEFNLTPSEDTNYLNFKNYLRRNNFTDRVAYNGNASFFLEPLEATSLHTANFVNREAWDIWNGAVTPSQAQYYYENEISNVESMICLHYMAGSIWNNDFWDYANQISKQKIKKEFDLKTEFAYNINDALSYKRDRGDVGTWSLASYRTNIEKLGLKSIIERMLRSL